MNTLYAGKYVSLLFLARDLAHRVHLKTRSFSEHSATAEFYENIIPLADSFAQKFQGCYGTLIDVPLMANEHKGTLLDVLTKHTDWIEANREKICPRENTAIHNIIDEAVGIYDQAKYHLQFLK
jgi:hypothetical protein